MPAPVRWTLPQARSLEAVNAIVTAPLYERGLWSWRAWWIGFAVSVALTAGFFLGVVLVLWRGIGIWGVNTTVVWGFAIADYVWWIGIGNAGTLISAMLLLMRQKWRASTNRFAEAMTLFAASHRRHFSDHPSRPPDVFLLADALPEHDDGVAAVAQRADLGFLGDPQLHHVLDHVLVCRAYPRSRHYAGSRAEQIRGDRCTAHWRSAGAARRAHWHAYETLHLALACLGVPLVVSLHSVVGMDFAASLMPGWQETIFPPYFVVGAMYSGFAMVVCLAALVRWGFRMEA